MSKNTKILLIAAVIFLVAALGLGIFIGYHEAEASTSSSSTSPLPLFISSWLPMMAVIFLSMQPTTPVQNVLYALSNKKLTADKKAKHLNYYISKSFKESTSYNALLNITLEKYKKVEVKEKGADKQIVTVILTNGEEYEFEVVKRTKNNSLSSFGQWLINDYRKI